MKDQESVRLGHMRARSNPRQWVFDLRLAAFFLIALIFLFPAAAQAQKRPELPAKLEAYEGKYPNRFMKLPAVKTRLHALLGKYYDDFTMRMGVQGTFERDGDILSVGGLMPHMGGSEDAILVIDLKTRTLHCGIFSDGTMGFNLDRGKKKKGLLKFSETPDKLPEILTNWSN